MTLNRFTLNESLASQCHIVICSTTLGAFPFVVSSQNRKLVLKIAPLKMVA